VTDYSAELGHVQLEVRDLERSVAFYTRYLGLEVTERMESRKGRVVLLSGGDRHREVGLRAASVPGPGGSGSPDAGGAAAEGGPDGTAGDGGGEGPATGGALSAPFQVAFEVPDRQALAELFFELRTADVPTTAVDHGVSWSIYFRDPDGNALEAYWDTRAEEGGRERWGGRSRLLSVEQILSDERIRELAERIRERAEEAEGETNPEETGEATAEGDDPDVSPEGEAPEAGPAEERPATSD
jgi:catechol 2,3-dioxygenase